MLHLGTRSGHILNPLKQQTQQVEQAWGIVRQTAQQTGAASALANLAQHFAALHEQHRALESLWTLAGHLRELRSDFLPCVRLVEQANGEPARLPFAQVQQRWNEVARTSLTTLAVFLERQPALAQDDWPQALAQQSKGIEAALKNLELKKLAERIQSLNQWLAETEAQVRQQVNEAFAALVEFSAQTIGRLELS